MAQNASVPAETDILCEHCGYGLNGLPTDSRCPECGELIADSTVGDGRVPPPWEQPGSTRVRFVRTVQGVVLTPTAFFRRLQTRSDHDRSYGFARRVHWLAAAMLGLTGAFHADVLQQVSLDGLHFKLLGTLLGAPVLMVIVFVVLAGVTRLASALTRLEGNFWGYRMPANAVRRAMNFHSAQLLPVAAVALVTVITYRYLRSFEVLSGLWDIRYLIVVCIEVLAGAGYLFRTYWIAMKNIMYANR